MESASDKDWASKYLLDPLNAPEPSQEDGPGNTFRPGATSSSAQTPPSSKTTPNRRLSKTNPYRKDSPTTTTTEIRRSVSMHSKTNGHGGKDHSRTSSAASPTMRQSPQSQSQPHSPRSPSHRQEAFGGDSTPTGSGRRRGSSLSERYPGDKSHRPLDLLMKEKATADRARHATKKHHIPPDIIDNLDHSGGAAWHHGGPYDATLYARNNSSNPISSPVAAVAESNAETLKATPKEKIIDSVVRHRPLDGVAVYPPGSQDPMGNKYSYEEGDNMMIAADPEGGAYKRWPGIQYDPEDVKGKGEPSYSIEKALKEHHISDDTAGNEGIEMKTRHRSSGSGNIPVEGDWEDGEGNVRRSGSIKRLSGGLKKRFGSIKRRSHHAE
ncbi:hypothetical protein HRR83_004563 [Exophiala dermatitidis]|uniref:Pal1 cell morphology protein n=2 Tax=Exophiala dermatitidis TaxID=5970 RepID=H6BR61_EXODN|nr:uncharacterized protein HMPREF1120_02101 [Exophiala dermatitidis NIH/UT8656]KAJ4515726.1 hypothetical protein HRR75_003807 [Exophiala dermatitidis]EHY53921.1 hypothetical protein HMPREF1120_02101 [Exophiala dermatitidis NIH/UT8656]KAJ4519412.1 hypothetical protein HRR74_004155 [Exophiala dermatitidis]KAJ4529228.1 hypothetical protein HRR73_000250 [Exophiala dermatitidis]KAJ4544124.1 hypothetical protein HRR76_002191 [Exophiala dermatitidis]